MRIIYYLPSLIAPGGLERIITFKANYFAENLSGYEVYIITSEQMGQKPHFALSPKVRHIDLGIPIDMPYNQSKVKKILSYPFKFRKFKNRLIAAVNEIKPDIFISTLRRELKFIDKFNDGSIKIGEFHVTRYSYGFGSQQSDNFIARHLHKRWETQFVANLKKLDRLVVLTNEETRNWKELDNLAVIPNPVTMPIEGQSSCTNHEVIAAGRYEPQKGFDMLIDSWAIVAAKHPDWTLRIFGDGGLRESLQAQIDRLNLSRNCILEHNAKDIAARYCDSSIFVLSSRFEGFGMVLAEAMSCGLPAVSFACQCGPRDIITDGKDGFLVPTFDTAMMAEKICRLIEDDTLRLEMGANALKSSARYTMKEIAKQWVELFSRLTNKKDDA